VRTKVAEKRFRGGESAAAIARNWSVTGALDTFTIRLTRAPRDGDAMKPRFRVGQVVTWVGQLGRCYDRIVKITKDDCGRDLFHLGPV